MSATDSGEVRAIQALMLGALAASTRFGNFPVSVHVEAVYDDDGIIDHLVLVTVSGLRYRLRLDQEQP